MDISKSGTWVSHDGYRDISFSFQDNSPITWEYWIIVLKIVLIVLALKYNHCLLYRRIAYIWNNTFMLLSINFSANRLICFGMTANRNFPNLSLATTLNLFYEYRLFDVEKKTVVLSRYVLFSHCYLWNRSVSAIISRKKNLQRIQYLRWDEKKRLRKKRPITTETYRSMSTVRLKEKKWSRADWSLLPLYWSSDSPVSVKVNCSITVLLDSVLTQPQYWLYLSTQSPSYVEEIIAIVFINMDRTRAIQ